ncbi:MAG: ATP-binding protein [Gallionella sp.]|jgi:signal transduction histidine kinase
MQLISSTAIRGPAPSYDKKEQLFASLCHEIRNPLNAIVGLSRIMGKQASPERQSECLHVLEQSAAMLEELLNDVLDFTRIDAGMMALESTPLDLTLLVEETAQMVAPRAREKNVGLHVHCPVVPLLEGDPLRLRQIILNLLGNAVKFTESGFISLFVQADPAPDGSYRIRMTVTDTGIGIPEDKQGTIFDEFRQADTAISSQYGGSGLGLAICKRLLEMMGGSISVVSMPGAGSQFTALLSLSVARQTMAA